MILVLFTNDVETNVSVDCLFVCFYLSLPSFINRFSPIMAPVLKCS